MTSEACPNTYALGRNSHKCYFWAESMLPWLDIAQSVWIHPYIMISHPWTKTLLSCALVLMIENATMHTNSSLWGGPSNLLLAVLEIWSILLFEDFETWGPGNYWQWLHWCILTLLLPRGWYFDKLLCLEPLYDILSSYAMICLTLDPNCQVGCLDLLKTKSELQL